MNKWCLPIFFPLANMQLPHSTLMQYILRPLLPPFSATISLILQANPKESLALAVDAMKLHFDLWQWYFDDFLQHKLQLGGLCREAISQQFLYAFFGQLHKQEALVRVVSLHCYVHTYHLDLAKMTNFLRPLNQIQQVSV